jgi:hypothetical protein
VQSELKLSGFSRAAAAALAGVLALLLLVSTAVSVSQALHQTVHHDGGATNHLCLVCLFAKGQVSAAEVGLVAPLAVLGVLCGIRLAGTSCLRGFDYRLSPSRAPPRS